MRGISEERLREIVEDYPEDHRSHRMAKYLIATECQELNPWLPIDENTPKDRQLIFWFPKTKDVGVASWNEELKFFVCAKVGNPTLYQKLPDDPEPGDKNG